MSGGHSSSTQTQTGQVYNAPVVYGGSITQGNVGVYSGPQSSSNDASGGSFGLDLSMPMPLPALLNLEGEENSAIKNNFAILLI